MAGYGAMDSRPQIPGLVHLQGQGQSCSEASPRYPKMATYGGAKMWLITINCVALEMTGSNLSVSGEPRDPGPKASELDRFIQSP